MLTNSREDDGHEEEKKDEVDNTDKEVRTARLMQVGGPAYLVFKHRISSMSSSCSSSTSTGTCLR